MKYRIIAFLTAAFLVLNSVCVPALPVHAAGGGGQRFDMSEWNEWSFEQKWMYYSYNFTEFLCDVIGFIVPYDFFEKNFDHFYNVMWDYVSPNGEPVDQEKVQEWVVSNIDYDEEEDEVIVSDDLADAMYESCCDYIEEHCGWYEYDTLDYRQLPASNFSSKGIYDAFIGYCTQNIKGTDKTIFVSGTGGDSVDGTVLLYATITEALENVEYYKKNFYATGADAYVTQEWVTVYPSYMRLYDNGDIKESPAYGTLGFAAFRSNYNSYFQYSCTPLTDGKKTVRVYKTMEDLKTYSVGQRPYYTTSTFQNYNVNGDNSCSISASELTGSSVYGDVVNYIITVEEGDGLTEDELRRILDEYFSRLPDGGSGGDSGGGSGGGSGDGLGGFLDAIGAIGDAILAILGKLLEIIAKAIELLGGTVNKVIELIPQNITNLIAGLFPFIPQEWLTAIELSLVLAVIVGIVGLFKK